MAMRPNKGKVLLVTLLLVLVVFGCTTSYPKVRMYGGDELAPDKYATVRAERKENEIVSIGRVDCEATQGVLARLFNGGHWADEVAILPGKHRLILQSVRDGLRSVGGVWVVAEAGERYVVHTQAIGYEVHMWVEHERTGRAVGGRVGSADEPADARACPEFYGGK
jgi:hypothetical protein